MQREWIKYENQKPSYDQDVLVTDGKYIFIASLQDYTAIDEPDSWYCSSYITGHDIKFWQLLPELPECNEK
jgi:hypothetical protein